MPTAVNSRSRKVRPSSGTLDGGDGGCCGRGLLVGLGRRGGDDREQRDEREDGPTQGEARFRGGRVRGRSQRAHPRTMRETPDRGIVRGPGETREEAGMGGRALVAALAVTLGAAGPAVAQTAPGAPGGTARWTTGAKQGVGTSTTTASKVWYSLADGVLSEVYYPRVDVADSRALELVDQRRHARSPTARATDTTHDDRARHRHARWSTSRSTPTSSAATGSPRPTSPTRCGRRCSSDVRFESLDRGRYAVYALYDPALEQLRTPRRGLDLSGGALVASEGDDRERARRRRAVQRGVQRLPGHQRRLDRPCDRSQHGLDLPAMRRTATSCRRRGCALDGRRTQRLTLALGVRHHR